MSNHSRGLRAALIATLAIIAACGNETVQPPADDLYPNCTLQALPLAGTANAPVLIYAALECQGGFVNLFATAVDSQGDADLLHVMQRIRVFEGSDCAAAFRDVTDDFVASGVEESFGAVFEQATDPTLYARICAAQSWPIEVELSDAAGNPTRGQVLATVIHAVDL